MSAPGLDYPAHLVRPPLHPMLVSFPIACLGGAVLTDITYWQTAEMQWSNFSAWLIAAGFILGIVALIAWVIDLVGRRYPTSHGAVWIYSLGNLVALVLAGINTLVHTRDGWTSVMPWGLTLSAATVLVLLVTTIIGWSILYRHYGVVAS